MKSIVREIENLKPDRIKICQFIHTLQGEGMFSGFPIILVRVFGCNLSCPFCDTAKLMYDEDSSKVFHIADLAARINRAFETANATHLLLTGGEPLLYDIQLLKLIELCNATQVEIETNGTLLSNELIQRFADIAKSKNISIQFNLSPKTKDLSRYVFEDMPPYVRIVYKLVIDADKPDVELINQAKQLFRGKYVYIMPMTDSNETVDTLVWKLRKLEKIARQCGVALTNRLHMMLYSDANETAVSFL